MAQYVSFCLIMGPFIKGNCLFLPDYRPFGCRSVHRDAVSLLHGPGHKPQTK